MPRTRIPRSVRLASSHLLAIVVSFHLGAFHRLYWNGCSQDGLDCDLTVSGSFIEPEPFLAGSARVDLDEFLGGFDLNVPLSFNGKSRLEDVRQVTFLYPQRSSSSPNSSLEDINTMPFLSVRNATANCRSVYHFSTNLGAIASRNSKSCVAIVRQTDSFNLQKWNRAPYAKGPYRGFYRQSRYDHPTDHSALLSRIPQPEDAQASLKVLRDYLDSLQDALGLLRPVAEQVANAGSALTKGTIVVIVCNFGLSELLINFVCTANKTGFDLSKILLFATDPETHDLAVGLGIASFYHEPTFASIPKEASIVYGDGRYARIMMSKVFCAHLVSQLGYGFLFQDVDISIYRPEYLEYFVNQTRTENFDL